MPIYEFQCNKCLKIKELLITNHDPIPVKCACSGSYKKLISHSSFVLKGTGWYATDYAKKDKKDSSEKTGQYKATETKTIKKEVANASK